MWPRCSDGTARARRRRRAAALLVVALLPFALACASPSMAVSDERRLGDEMDREARREFVVMRDELTEDYVSRIGQQILQAAGPQPFAYHFSVVEEDEINAFALPAGHIYVHTGTILKARNVSELAGVIAHEVGHVVRHHVTQNYERQQTTGALYRLGVLTAALLGGGFAAGIANLGGGLAAATYVNSFSREAENEADAFAVEILPRAGYDPQGLVDFFQTLINDGEGGGGVPSFLSSHPATAERIEHTSALIAALPDRQGLRVDDDGRLEIIQRRIRLLTRHYGPQRR
jgi:predicted Zn-dependent protease